MGIENQVGKATFPNYGFQIWFVPTFREPESTRRFPEVMLARLSCDDKLRSPGFIIGHEWQERMRCRAGDDFDQAFVLQLSERAQQTAAVALEELAGSSKEFLVHHRQRLKCQVVTGTLDFLICQFHPTLEVAAVAGLQQPIVEHFRQRRRDGDGKTAGDFVLCQSAENIDQRKVALSDGFKEPVFLQESWVLGMADKRKVSMQDDGEETLGHSSDERRGTMATTENLRNLQRF